MSLRLFETIPSVEKLSRSLEPNWEKKIPRRLRNRIVRNYLETCRAMASKGIQIPTFTAMETAVEQIFKKLTHRQFRKAINATGVILHTNLGRAPVGKETLEKAVTELSGYSLLEMDENSPQRGSRTQTIEPLLSHLCGAEASIVVNNNAAAVLLSLFALARGEGAIVSRGELVQIGGGFRVPDILEASGSPLIEVGTTNITTPQDYLAAMKENPGAVLVKVHQSNFVMQGHVDSVSVGELARMADAHGVALIVDWGSGSLWEKVGEEPSVSDLLHDGAPVLCFSGDKLLGGPQAGIVVGKKVFIDRLKNSPLYRALRLSKFELFLLENCLLDFLAGIPNETQKLLALGEASLKLRADRLSQILNEAGLSTSVVPGQSTVGGGTSPQLLLDSWLVEWAVNSERAAQLLFEESPAVIVRRERGKVLMDLRTVFETEDEILFTALNRVASQI